MTEKLANCLATFWQAAAPLVAPITDMAEIHEVLAEACRNTLQNVNATIARQQSEISKEPA